MQCRTRGRGRIVAAHLVSERREVLVVIGRVRHVSHQRQHPLVELLPPDGVELRYHSRGVDVVPVVEVMVVVKPCNNRKGRYKRQLIRKQSLQDKQKVRRQY